MNIVRMTTGEPIVTRGNYLVLDDDKHRVAAFALESDAQRFIDAMNGRYCVIVHDWEGTSIKIQVVPDTYGMTIDVEGCDETVIVDLYKNPTVHVHSETDGSSVDHKLR